MLGHRVALLGARRECAAAVVAAVRQTEPSPIHSLLFDSGQQRDVSIQLKRHVWMVNPRCGVHARQRSNSLTFTPHSDLPPTEPLFGRRVSVYWPRERQLFPGVIADHDPRTDEVEIVYDDGDVLKRTLR